MKIIGHRGAKGLAPENTVFGLQAALRLNVKEIEIDVRVTQDGVPVLAHDPFIRNDSGATMDVHKHTHEQLRMFQPSIDTLDSALNFIDTKADVIIEIKPGEPLTSIIAVIQEYLQSGLYAPRNILLSSFDFPILKALHIALPDCPIIVNEKWSGVRATWRARRLHTKRLCMNARWLWKGFIQPMHRRGWQLTAYTVNDPELAKRWQKYGLYGIYTDFPDRFQK